MLTEIRRCDHYEAYVPVPGRFASRLRSARRASKRRVPQGKEGRQTRSKEGGQKTKALTFCGAKLLSLRATTASRFRDPSLTPRRWPQLSGNRIRERPERRTHARYRPRRPAGKTSSTATKPVFRYV